MTTPRRRSARILQKVTSESEASDLNTDDELTLLTQTPTTHRRLKKPSKRTPAKSTVKKIIQAERVPETVYEQAEETEDAGNPLNVSDKVESSTQQHVKKSSRRRIENVVEIADNDEEDSLPKPISSPKKSPKKKIKSPLESPSKSAEDEFIKLDDESCDEAQEKLETTAIMVDKNISQEEMNKEKFNNIEEVSNVKEASTGDNESSNSERCCITKDEENQPCETKIQTEAKKKPRFKVDLKKYEDSNSTSPLLRLGFKLKNSTVFKDHFQQIKNKGKPSQRMIVNDICGLDGIQLDESVKKEPKIETNLDIKKSTSQPTKDSANKQVEKLMKKSVLLPDMEKEKNCPVFNQSRYSIAKERKKQAQETAGPGWYNLPKTELTDEIKRDMQVLKMRKVLDTKQHYKRDDSKAIPKFFQMGTIVEGSHEYYSSRMSKKQRKRTMVDELLADSEFRKKNKKRMIEYEMRKGAGGKGHHKNKIQKRKPSKQRT